MIKHIYQLFCLFILAACTDNGLKTTETQLITDSYFFQKQSLNLNIYECNQNHDYDFKNYRQSTLGKTFLKISEIAEKDNNIDGCIHEYIEVDELTPASNFLLEDSFFIEIMDCSTLTQKELEESMRPFLLSIETNSLEIWAAITKLNNNQFNWINIWPSEQIRNDFMQDWVNLSASGKLASELGSDLFCNNHKTYSFNKLL